MQKSVYRAKATNRNNGIKESILGYQTGGSIQPVQECGSIGAGSVGEIDKAEHGQKHIDRQPADDLPGFPLWILLLSFH